MSLQTSAVKASCEMQFMEIALERERFTSGSKEKHVSLWTWTLANKSDTEN